MCDYKLWMENINNNNTDFKMKPNVYKIILFNLLNNENNINVNIPLVIANNYFIWTIIHILKIPKKILNHFHLQLNNSLNSNNINNCETPKEDNSDDKDEIYKNYIFDEKYLLKNINQKENIDYKTNNRIIEKLCLNLENKIVLAKIDLIYIELICKNINDLCLGNSLIIEEEFTTIKNTAITLTKLLINFLQIPNSGFIEQDSSIEEIICFSLEKVANNLYDESYFNKQLGNLPKIMEVISEYETNQNLINNFVKSMALSAIYLISILDRLKQKDDNNSPLKCLYKKIKYNINELLKEKDSNNIDNNRFTILYEKKSKIIFYDDIFLYHCYLNNGMNNVEINDIIFIKNSIKSTDKINDKLIFKINNDIIINFDCDETGEKELQNLENKFKEIRDNIKNNFPKIYKRLYLDNVLKYAEQL